MKTLYLFLMMLLVLTGKAAEPPVLRFPWTTNDNGAGLLQVIASIPTVTTNLDTLAEVIAINSLPAGSVASVSAGFYNLGTNQLIVPNGVSIIGAGSDRVTFYGYADCWGSETTGLPTGGPQYHPGHNSVHQGFRLLCDVTNMIYNFTNFIPVRHSGMWSGFGVSAANTPANLDFTNVLVRDVLIEGGWWDGVHVNSTGRCQARFEFCKVVNGGQSYNFIPGTATPQNNLNYFELVACIGISDGTPVPPALASQSAYADPAFINSSHELDAYGCTGITFTNSSLDPQYSLLFGPASPKSIKIHGGTFVSSNPNDISYNRVAGRFHWNGAEIEPSLFAVRRTFGPSIGFTITNKSFSANNSLTFKPADFDPTIMALAYGDSDDGIVDFLRFNTGSLELMNPRFFLGDGRGLTNLTSASVASIPKTNYIHLSGWYPGSDGSAAAEFLNTGFFNRPPANGQTFTYGALNGTGYRTNIVRWVFYATNSTAIPIGTYIIGQGSLTSVAAKQAGTVIANGVPVNGTASMVYASVTNYHHASIGQTNRFMHLTFTHLAPISTNFMYYIGAITEWYP